METQMMASSSIAFVIFGVTGDLTRRKLIPALYESLINKKLFSPMYIIGFARRDWTEEIYVENLKSGVREFARTQPVKNDLLSQLLEKTHYIKSSFNEATGYTQLKQYLQDNHISNVLFYLATPPDAYVEIIRHIGTSGLMMDREGWTRIIIEKPYGNDLASAQNLENEVHKVFNENQVYRIDHYLGKETVQNILVFRYANGIFEPLWNRNYVDHVQILVAETVGVGTRGGYYDSAGVIRDMFQNHLLQLLALTAMEAPVAFNEDAVRDEKVKVLKALRPMRGNDVLENTYRAQYVSGMMEGKRVVGYKDEKDVPSSSVTETYLAARLFIDNWKWAGVPFYLRSGKCFPCRATEIAIQFKQIPLSLFNWHNMAGDAPNVLVLNLQPNEGIELTFGAKVPGPINQIAPVKMEFNYCNAFGVEPPEAYERLLMDSLMGDATLFTRSDEVNSQWHFTTNILETWKTSGVRHLPVYEAGTWGPPGADDFIGKDRRSWHNPCVQE